MIKKGDVYNMAVPEYIKPTNNKTDSWWINGLKNEAGKLNGFGIHAYATLAINLFYFISNTAFWLWGNVWYIDSVVLRAFFENFLLFFDVLIWFTYLPYLFISAIAQIIGAIKAKRISGIFIVNLILSFITPVVTVIAMSQCF